MKKLKLCMVLVILSINLTWAQDAIEKEVNETLWKTFVESWSSFDAEAFNNLHTDDVLRASGNWLTVGKAYKDRNTQSFASSKAKKDKRMIHFWLEHRAYSGDTGYEVGYYKIVNNRPGQEQTEHYARFHIVLKKQNGQWKIAQDWDTSSINGTPIGKDDWEKGTPLVF